jgi:DMSO/TMAO reductase YedYZ molybdopterin-dependent catalytic subunit
VDRELEFSIAGLLNRPLIERDITLNCVSNEVGDPYIGTARWLGVPLSPLLREAGIKPGTDQIVARSTEGMTIGTPAEAMLDGGTRCYASSGARPRSRTALPVGTTSR